MFSDKRFGLSSSLIAATRGILGEEKEDKDKVDPKMMKGGKTKVDLEPKTDDDTRDYDDKKKSMKEGKEHTIPKTDKEKKLAALASPKDKITHKDVLVGRGVVKEEEAEIEEASMFSSKVKQGKGAAADIGSARYDFGKNAAPRRPDDTGKNVLSRRVFVKGAKPKGKLPEEVDLESLTEEDLEEALKKSQPAGEWIKDFVKSDNPKFAGKSKKKRMQMALGAYYAKQRNEETEIEEAINMRGVMDRAERKTGAAEYKTHMRKKAEGEGSEAEAARRWLGHKPGTTGADVKKMNAARMNKEEVELSDEELERLEAIAQSLDEAKPTIVSAPIRGANQDQSGENTKSTSTDYTISDSKKMKKEELELDEAKRGRPKKNPTPDDEQDEHEHVIMQLRKVVSTHGALPVKHLDGKSTKITPQLAQHALNKHSAMKTAAEKQDFESKMHKSHDSMKSALGQ